MAGKTYILTLLITCSHLIQICVTHTLVGILLQVNKFQNIEILLHKFSSSHYSKSTFGLSSQPHCLQEILAGMSMKLLNASCLAIEFSSSVDKVERVKFVGNVKFVGGSSDLRTLGDAFSNTRISSGTPS